MVKRLPVMWETQVRFLGREDPLEKEMAIHSSTVAWKIPWTEEPDRLQSMGSRRVGHDWVTSLSLSASKHKKELVGTEERREGSCLCVLVTRSCPTLCNIMDYSPPRSSVYGILQGRILAWVAIPFSRGSSQHRGRTQVYHIACRFFTVWATSWGWDEVLEVYVLSSLGHWNGRLETQNPKQDWLFIWLVLQPCLMSEESKKGRCNWI